MSLASTIAALQALPGWKIGSRQEISLLPETGLSAHLPFLRNIADDEAMFMEGGSDAADLRIPALRNLATAGEDEDLGRILDLLVGRDYEDPDFADAFTADFGWLVMQLGAKTVPALCTVTSSIHVAEIDRSCGIHALEGLASAGIEAEAIFSEFNETLSKSHPHRHVNGVLAKILAQHRAAEAGDLILKSYDLNIVDVTVTGDRENLEILLGRRTERDTPAPDLNELETERLIAFRRKILGPLPTGEPPARILEYFIYLYETPAGVSDIHMLHGLLTALIISPEMPPPTAPVKLVWDLENPADGKGPIWEGLEEASLFMSAMMNYQNEIIDELDSGEYEPFLEEIEFEEGEDFEVMEGPHFSGDSWGEGFNAAVPYLRKLFGPTEFAAQLEAVFEEFFGECLQYPEMDEAQREASTCNVIDFVTAVRQGPAPIPKAPLGGEYEVFSPYEKPLPATREAEKVGRNDPCPCGSGRKYKKCCAN